MQERRPVRSSAVPLNKGPEPAFEGAWPNLFIVGAVKAGTTSLHRYLAQHPEIYMSPVKEPHFFSDIDPHHQDFDESSYLRLFAPSKGEKIRGESSPLYLWDPSTPQRIDSTSPNAKIIIMLRHPVTRAYAHYLMDVQQGRQKLPFEQAIQRELDRPHHLYIELGRYCRQVARYLDMFKGRVFAIVFEDFVGDVRAHLREVFGFLGVNTDYATSIDVGIHNEYRGPLNVLGRAAHGIRIVESAARSFVPASVRAHLRRSVLANKKPRMEAKAEGLLGHVYRHEPECLSRVLGREVRWNLRLRGGRGG
jgi:sulfotransferase family protein